MKRVQKNRIIKDTILILTNGKQTEKNYFNNLKSYFDSMFTIKVEFQNLQCDKLVEFAITRKVENYNQIWCVFDIDDSFAEGHLTVALHLAQKNNIKICYSNESFEVWLLYHLVDNVKETLSRNTYSKEINKVLEIINENLEYKKNNEDIIKRYIIPKALEATQKAKKKYQLKELEHQKEYYGNMNYKIWEWKSTTTVFRLIESLNLTEKSF